MLRGDGFSVSCAEDGEAALAAARLAPPDVVLTDLRMPKMDGVSLCQRLHEIDPDLPVILMTAFDERETVLVGLRNRLRASVRPRRRNLLRPTNEPDR